MPRVDTVVSTAVWVVAALWIVVIAYAFFPRSIPPSVVPAPSAPSGDPSVDPLDATGKLPNQFTGNANRCDWASLSARWSGLPVYSDKTKLLAVMDSLERNNVTMIVSGTGSGKTVIVPKLAHLLLKEQKKAGRGKLGESVALWLSGKRPPGSVVATTNPKRLTTTTNAEYSAKLACVRLGSEIGYRYRDSPKDKISRKTELEYVTDGFLLTVASTDPEFTDYGVIVVDEAHERQVPSDFLLLALRKAMKARPELRVVVMSATMDTAPFIAWFEREGLSVGDISVSGEPNFPVDRVFVPLSSGERAISRAIEIAFGIQKNPASRVGGIAIFVATTADVIAGCAELTRVCQANGLACSSDIEGGEPDLRCLNLFSGVSDAEKNVAQKESVSSATRNVIFATNVAESSLTIDGLSYVIDMGKAFRSRYDAVTDTVVNGTETITKAETVQRIGRVGRIGPGVAYLLYPERIYNRMLDQPPPAISTTDVSGEMFTLFASKDDWRWTDLDAYAMDMLTPPTRAQMSIARSTLLFYGLVDARGFKTVAGDAVYSIMTSGRMTLVDALFMLAAQISGAVDDAAMTVLSNELKAITVYGRALTAIGRQQLCPFSQHQTIRSTMEAAFVWFPFKTGQHVERLQEITSAARKAQISLGVYGIWPWSWLFRQWLNPIGALCSAVAGKLCQGSPVRLSTCDAYYRAILASNFIHCVQAGRRVFGSNRRLATGPPGFPDYPGAVLVGTALAAGKDTDSLLICTAFDPRSVESLFAAIPKFGA